MLSIFVGEVEQIVWLDGNQVAKGEWSMTLRRSSLWKCQLWKVVYQTEQDGKHSIKDQSPGQGTICVRDWHHDYKSMYERLGSKTMDQAPSTSLLIASDV